MPSRRNRVASGAQESSLDANLRPVFDTRGGTTVEFSLRSYLRAGLGGSSIDEFSGPRFGPTVKKPLPYQSRCLEVLKKLQLARLSTADRSRETGQETLSARNGRARTGRSRVATEFPTHVSESALHG